MFESLEVRLVVPEGTVAGGNDDLTAHLGETPQPELDAVGGRVQSPDVDPSSSRPRRAVNCPRPLGRVPGQPRRQGALGPTPRDSSGFSSSRFGEGHRRINRQRDELLPPPPAALQTPPAPPRQGNHQEQPAVMTQLARLGVRLRMGDPRNGPPFSSPEWPARGRAIPYTHIGPATLPDKSGTLRMREATKCLASWRCSRFRRTGVERG